MTTAKKTPVWQMTVGEWDKLSGKRKATYATKYPPYPYHSNFHLVRVLDAIKSGKRVPQRVIKSFGANSAIKHALGRDGR